MTFSVPAIAAGVATLAAAPAAADAAVVAIAPAAPCYVSGEPVGMAATGYTPNGHVTVKLGRQVFGSAAVDPAGNVTGVSLLFGVFHGVHRQKLTVTDQTNPALVASKSIRTSGIFVRLRPAGGPAGTVRRVTAGGFITGTRLYAHQVRGRTVQTFAVGRVHGPCHGLSVRARVTSRHAATGTYTVQFDTNRRYSSRARIRARFRLRVYRTGGASDAGAGAVTAGRQGRLMTSWTSIGLRVRRIGPGSRCGGGCVESRRDPAAAAGASNRARIPLWRRPDLGWEFRPVRSGQPHNPADRVPTLGFSPDPAPGDPATCP